MNISRASLIALTTSWFALSSPEASAKLNVVTTTTDLAAIVAEVGGDRIAVTSIGKGTQDPHYVEAKPSFMTKVAKADLLIAVGLDLEIGWLPSILRGARNPRVLPGAPGYLEIGVAVDPIDLPDGKISRAEGDVHPFGNPHFYLDPVRLAKAAQLIGERLSSLDAPHAHDYTARATALSTRLNEKTKAWQERVTKSGVKYVVTYHKTLNYFLDRFGVVSIATLEPKPGVPPTTGHVLDVIHGIREQKVGLILVENYFDDAVARRIKKEVPEIRIVTVPVAVEGVPGLATSDQLIELLVSTLEGGAK